MLAQDRYSFKELRGWFFLGLFPTIVVFLIAMDARGALQLFSKPISARLSSWLQFIVATPVVMGCGWPLWVNFKELVLSLTGISLAFGYSLVALLFPDLFPSTILQNGEPTLHFDLAAGLTLLVLLGQILVHWFYHEVGAHAEKLDIDLPLQLTMQRQATLIASWLPLLILFLFFFTFVFWKTAGPYPSITHSLMNAIAVLVIIYPSSLPLAVSLAVKASMECALAKGVLISQAKCMETLAKMDVLMLDKSNLIAMDKLVVSDVIPIHSRSMHELLLYPASIETHCKHPVAGVLIEASKEAGIALGEPQEVKEHLGLGASGYVEGKFILVGNLKFLRSFEVEMNHHLLKNAERLQRKGKSVLYVAIDKVAAGLISIEGQVKRPAVFAIKRLHEKGVRVILATGENCITANVLAKEAGVDAVESEISQEERMAVIKRLQHEGFVVAMIADDPVNQFIVANQADVSFLTHATSENTGACVALSQEGLMGVFHAFHLSRSVMRVVGINFYCSLVFSVFGLSVAMGLLYPFWSIELSPLVAAGLMDITVFFTFANALRLRQLLRS